MPLPFGGLPNDVVRFTLRQRAPTLPRARPRHSATGAWLTVPRAQRPTPVTRLRAMRARMAVKRARSTALRRRVPRHGGVSSTDSPHCVVRTPVTGVSCISQRQHDERIESEVAKHSATSPRSQRRRAVTWAYPQVSGGPWRAKTCTARCDTGASDFSGE